MNDATTRDDATETATRDDATREPVTFATVTVRDAGLFALTGRIDKLNKRARKLGQPVLTATVVAVKVCRNKKTDLPYDVHSVEITGIAPRVDGWRLVARVEFNDTVGTIVHVAPGDYAECDYSAYRTIPSTRCDHCNTSRVRNDVFVLRDCNGSHQVIGRNCLADFCRDGDSESLAFYAECMDFVSSAGSGDLDEEGDREYRNNNPSMSLLTFLTSANCCARRMGAVSRTAARNGDGGMATADAAVQLLYGSGKYWAKWVEENELVTNDNDADLADKAIAWAASLESPKSEYLATIASIATAGATDIKLAGYSASITGAYQRELGYAAERAEKAAGRKETGYLGSGEKCKTQDWGVVTVVRVRYTEGEYGTTTIVAMEQEGPNDTIIPITWFASGSKEFDVDAQYTLRAGIKGSKDDDKWGKQTFVTRAKLTPVA